MPHLLSQGCKGGEVKGNKGEDAKVVGKLHSTQLKTTLPLKTSPIPSTIVTSKPITKVIPKGIKIG